MSTDQEHYQHAYRQPQEASETIAELQAEVEKLRADSATFHERAAGYVAQVLALQSCEVVMRAALMRIGKYPTSREDEKDHRACRQIAAAALKQCPTDNPEFQPLDAEGRPLPLAGSES